MNHWFLQSENPNTKLLPQNSPYPGPLRQNWSKTRNSKRKDISIEYPTVLTPLTLIWEISEKLSPKLEGKAVLNIDDRTGNHFFFLSLDISSPTTFRYFADISSPILLRNFLQPFSWVSSAIHNNWQYW